MRQRDEPAKPALRRLYQAPAGFPRPRDSRRGWCGRRRRSRGYFFSTKVNPTVRWSTRIPSRSTIWTATPPARSATS